jgi:type IV secretory pathway VirB10-like protein
MRSQWAIAAVLSSALIVGCGDRGADNTQNTDQVQDQAPAAGAGAADQVNPSSPEAPAPGAENPVSRPDRDENAAETRATTGSRPAPPAARPQSREVTVPAGTALPLELTTAISSATATVEMPVSARLRQAVVINGNTVIPAGSILQGEVFEVERAGRVKGRSRLAIRFNQVRMDGVTEDLRSNPVIFEGEATKGEDATKVGVGAGIGAAIGGVVGGGSGAAKGAAIGGAAGAGTVLATRGREVELASGTNIEATLASPLEVRVAAQ